MPKITFAQLSRRERQIMDAIYTRGRATAAEVLEGLPDPPSYSAVRAMLRILEDKGALRHEYDGPRYVYIPIVPRESAQKSALRHIVSTFFGGSTAQAVAALLDDDAAQLSKQDIDRLARIIQDAKSEGR